MNLEQVMVTPVLKNVKISPHYVKLLTIHLIFMFIYQFPIKLRYLYLDNVGHLLITLAFMRVYICFDLHT